MTAPVCELLPGNVVEMDHFGRGTLISYSTPHPQYRGLALVVWLVEPTDGVPFYSYDALHPRQEVGRLLPWSEAQRMEILRAALEPGRVVVPGAPARPESDQQKRERVAGVFGGPAPMLDGMARFDADVRAILGRDR